MPTNTTKETGKQRRKEQRQRSRQLPSSSSSKGGGISAAASAAPDPNEIINRDDYTISNPTRYKFVYSSPGPPRAEIHLVTAAHLVLPDTKMVCKLDDSIIPQLVEQRVEMMKADAEDEERERKKNTGVETNDNDDKDEGGEGEDENSCDSILPSK
jgi:hypothetical protein